MNRRLRSVYFGTTKYNFTRFWLSLMIVGLDGILLGVLMLLGLFFNTIEASTLLFIVWIPLAFGVKYLVMRSFGYQVKCGHSAVVIEALMTGYIPQNQLNFGLTRAKRRFRRANTYYLAESLTKDAVKQTMAMLEKSGRLYDSGTALSVYFLKMFLAMTYRYFAQCLLGNVFLSERENVFQAASSGVAVFYAHWKTFMKKTAVYSITVILSMLTVTVIGFILFALIFRIFEWNLFIAFVLALMLAFAVKFAFVDTGILASMLCDYTEAALNTQITTDMIGRLCSSSPKFRELFNRGRKQRRQPPRSEKTPEPAAPSPEMLSAAQQQPQMADDAAVPEARLFEAARREPVDPQFQPTDTGLRINPLLQRPSYCTNCGAKNAPGTTSCKNCGARL